MAKNASADFTYFFLSACNHYNHKIPLSGSLSTTTLQLYRTVKMSVLRASSRFVLKHHALIEHKMMIKWSLKSMTDNFSSNRKIAMLKVINSFLKNSWPVVSRKEIRGIFSNILILFLFCIFAWNTLTISSISLSYNGYMVPYRRSRLLCDN